MMKSTWNRWCVLLGVCLGASAGSLDAQTVTSDCPADECHVVPFAQGRGGFVGRALNASREVEVRFLCQGGNTTKVVARDLVPGPSGLVTLLFGIDNGTREALVCEPGREASLEIRGLSDGGWYWIHGESNSAVAPLLAKDVLRNRKVRPVSPGSGDILVESNRAGTASLVTQLSTGRVGVLSHVLPEPEREVVPCGPVADGELADGSPRYVARETGCTMGDGGTLVALHTHGVTGRPVTVHGGRVIRPHSGEVEIGVSLWLNRTGSVVYGDPGLFPPTFGWPGIEGARALESEWQVVLLPVAPVVTLEHAGIDVSALSEPGGDGDRHILVLPADNYCPAEGEQYSVKLRVRATRTVDIFGEPVNPVRPLIRHSDDLDGAAAETTFDVVCPERETTAPVAGETMGRELAFPSGPVRR